MSSPTERTPPAWLARVAGGAFRDRRIPRRTRNRSPDRTRAPRRRTLAVSAAGAATLVLASTGTAIVLAAADRPSSLTPSSRGGFPDWFSGPLGAFGAPLGPGAFEPLFLAMCAAYLVALRFTDALPARAWWAAIVALHAVFAIAPPLLTTDVFGYLAYARLGATEDLSPYSHGASELAGDPVHPFVVWHDDPSPYGPLFTVFSYALAPLSVPAGMWTLKAIAAAASLALVAVTARSARDPVTAAVFVGLNPLLLVYAVGGGHNDLPMMLCVTAAAAHVGRFMHPYGAQHGPRRRGVAGVAAAVASAIKASALFVIPPLVLSRRALIGFAAGAGAAALIGLAVIGPGLAEFPSALAEQSKLTSEHSVPTELSRWLGLDGPTDAVRALAAATFGIVLALLVGRTLRGGDPIAAAAWAAIAALVTTAWLMPWYVVWALPLAALAPGRGPRAAALGVCAFVVATRFELLLA